MERSAVWRHIHAERAAMAAALASQDDAAWQTESLCAGWTVHDVAAHVISNPSIGWGGIAAMSARNVGRGYNTMIFREVKRLGARATRESILADFERYADSTRHVPVTTSVEPLIDSLVHHQDVLRPLGLRHEMDPEAARLAADRVCRMAFLMGTSRLLRSVRLEATDIDWERGRGPVVRGPMQELLMVAAGRDPDLAEVEGDGLALLHAR